MIRLTILLAILLGASPAWAARCALVTSADVILEYATVAECPPDPTGKGWRWVPADIPAKPAHDPATQVVEGPTETIGQDAVTYEWTVRNKTAQELDDEKTAKANDMSVAVFKALCHLKNEIRTRVQGLAAWTEVQCFDAFKGLLP